MVYMVVRQFQVTESVEVEAVNPAAALSGKEVSSKNIDKELICTDVYDPDGEVSGSELLHVDN